MQKKRINMINPKERLKTAENHITKGVKLFLAQDFDTIGTE
jgi:hypothetical protein